MGPESSIAKVELRPDPVTVGLYMADWGAVKPGSYVVETVAHRGDEEVGRDVMTFRREDGVAENFGTSRTGNCSRSWRRNRRPVLEAGEIGKAGVGHLLFRSRHLRTGNPRPLGRAGLLHDGSAAPLSEWLLRRKWGVV